MKPIAILGSTGSIGQQAVEVARHLNCRIELLVANSSYKEVEKQAREFSPSVCVMTDEESARLLKDRLKDTSIRVYGGYERAIEEIEKSSAQTFVNAVSGFAGLEPALAVARSGKRLAMANKEAIITSYRFIQDEIEKNGGELIPVDSEHSAIFQSLQGRANNEIKNIILTASGGPFRHKSREELSTYSAKDALNHPTWKMGAKITVDSASLMNKGFEVMEAVRLFGVSPEQIDVVVHPQSILHSAVTYTDNAVIAQLGAPDMRTCIQYALTYPNREISLAKPLDFSQIGSLTFEKPDMNTFSLLKLAFYAIKEDGVLPAVLNASDEVAVHYFLQDKISFTTIFDVVEQVVKSYPNIKNPTLEQIKDADRQARILTEKTILSSL